MDKVTKLQDKPFSPKRAMRRIRDLVKNGNVIWTPAADERSVMLGLSGADFLEVIRFGEVTESRKVVAAWLYTVAGLDIEGRPVAYIVEIAGMLLVVRVIAPGRITEE